MSVVRENSTMQELNHYFEYSTVHGLSYISNTKKLSRLFWIMVVLSGFTCAGILIYQSFKAWEENPVTTTIETLPISKVCKN